MLVNIEVDQPKIAEGRVLNCLHCPIALAINATLKPEFHANVGPFAGLIEGESLSPLYKFRLPDSAKSFIDSFDDGRKAFAFTFALDIPPEFLREQPCPTE